MTFETSRDVLAWYEKQPRALTEEFVAAIDWRAVGGDGLEFFDKNVSLRIQNLPGFDGLTKASDKIGEIVLQNTSIVSG